MWGRFSRWVSDLIKMRNTWVQKWTLPSTNVEIKIESYEKLRELREYIFSDSRINFGVYINYLLVQLL